MRFSIAFLLPLLAPLAASAHAIGVEARLVEDKVRVEVFFDDDTPASDAKVTVEDESRQVIAEGRTDEKGYWTFAKPNAGRYAVRVDAGDGHAAKTTITIRDETPAAATISNGPGRETFTGWNRLAMTAVGLAAIAGLTLVLIRARRTPPNQ